MKENDKLTLDLARHSLAHVMAYAIKELYGDVKFAIGPPIDNGFYYDIDMEQKVLEEDYEKIENKMKELLKQKHDFVKEVISKEKALELFKDQPYKIELINDFDENEEISIYTCGSFVDLCRGPHVKNFTELLSWAFKIHSVTGAYFRGDSNNKMLQRFYAYAFPSNAELKEYIKMKEEAKKRDHRVLGPQQDLFFIDDTAPGMPYWLPKGLKMINTLLDFWRKEHEKRGYEEIATPLINSSELWKKSGHWNHYKENMFLIPLDDKRTFAAKPMNCPNAMIVFGRKIVSYKELPMRLSDSDTLHRNESSGTLHGLLRVQSFRQDDAHIFLKEDQIFDEINQILDIADLFYGIFGLKYRPELSTRPVDFMGEIALWDKAESELRHILDARYGENGYDVNEGDGAFYGPKIDIMMEDALKRTWQMGTIQLDFQLPLNFNLQYIDKDGQGKTPVVVHRVIYGSLERFMGIIIEHFAGVFPFWISPLQIGIVPVMEIHNEYAKSIHDKLQNLGFKVSVKLQDEPMGSKVKFYRQEKAPYTIIVGDQEMNDNKISLKIRGNKQANMVDLDVFIAKCFEMNANKSLDLVEEF